MSLHDNPLYTNTGVPDFVNISADHVKPAVTAVLAELKKEFQRIETNAAPTWIDLVEPLELIDVRIHNVYAPVGHLMSVKNNDALRRADDEVRPQIVEFGLITSQSRPVFDKLKALRYGSEFTTLNHAQQRSIDLRIRAAELAGIGLLGSARDRFNQIQQRMSQLGTKFSNNHIDAIKGFEQVLTQPDEVSGLPESWKALTAQRYNQKHTPEKPSTADAGPWLMTLDAPALLPFLEYGNRRDLREHFFKINRNLASSGECDNTPLITEILQLRREEAEILGLKTFAELSLKVKMAPNPEAVYRMYADLQEACRKPGEKDFDLLKEFAANNGFAGPFEAWDYPFWRRKLTESELDFDPEKLRPYFPFDHVLKGLFELANRLFGVRLDKRPAGEFPTWDPDVSCYDVRSENGDRMASLYLDPYSRPGDKRSGAWLNSFVDRGRRANGSLVLPVSVISANFIPPVNGKPALLTPDEVETLFHEFGHATQHMLTTIDVTGVAGINGVEWDAVELASQFMENWLYHPPVIKGISRHIETGKSIDDSTIATLKKVRTFHSALQIQRQIHLGKSDFDLHHKFDPNGSESPFDVFNRVGAEVCTLPAWTEGRFLCSFGHVFAGGYSAGYYSYLWAEILSADTFGAFEEAGIDNDAAVREQGRRYRDTILALGGSQNPMEIFRAFRGREPNIKAFLRHRGLQ